MITIDYTSRLPITTQIREQMVRLITSGALGPGEWLPSVRQLATELSINPNTIQKAYSEMEMRGIIVSVKGRGSFVAENTDGATKAMREKMLETLAEAVRCGKLLSLTSANLKEEIERIWNREERDE